jgi:glycosyltransferase involved in cell wall biosynthesis
MKISILASNLSSNAMGRVLVLARVLERRYDVEIVGPMFGDEIWGPIAEEDLDINAMDIDESTRSMTRVRRLSRMPTGDVLYACKPVWTSFGAALRARAVGGARRPLVLDIDDWEWGFARHAIRTARNKPRYLAANALHAHLPNAWPSAWWYDRRTSLADAVTVSNSLLQNRYGGEIVWHGRDTDAFDPERYPRDEARRNLQFGRDERIVMFFGTIHPYKGVEDLIHAFARLERDDARLVLVGAGGTRGAESAVELARSELGDRVTVFGVQPFERVPEFIAAADVVVIPQRSTEATRWQMPAKIFDAMAMSKPIVATAVCNIPEVLEGCGWVVEPDSPEALAGAIREVLDDSARASAAGAAARHKCVAEHSWDAMERTLETVFDKLSTRPKS